MNVIDRSEIRKIDGETLRFNPDGTVELKLYEFFFQLEELEPEKKARFSESVRRAITEHWLSFINSRDFASRRSLSGANAYHDEIRDLNRSRNVSSCRFELREIGGERLRFHNPSGQVVIKVGNAYAALSALTPSQAREINQSVFLAAENYLRSWRPA